MDWEQAAATTHVVAALSALLVGAAVLLSQKGTQVHRTVGGVYILGLLVVDVAALSLHREDAFGVFHVLALASLATVVVGVVPLLLGRRSPKLISTHAYCMTWSYAGLVAAGCGQLAAASGQGLGMWFVPAVIAAVLTIGGIAIFGRVPAILDRVLAE